MVDFDMIRRPQHGINGTYGMMRATFSLPGWACGIAWAFSWREPSGKIFNRVSLTLPESCFALCAVLDP